LKVDAVSTKPTIAYISAGLAWLLPVIASSAAGASIEAWHGLDTTQPLYVDRDNNDIHTALPTLIGKDRDNALLIERFPSASWFSGGTPAEVKNRVAAVVSRAMSHQQVPVLVPYNLPFRDCQQYSSGGAANTADYKAWIDAVAAGIGQHRAIVILEPDSLGIIPHYTSLAGLKEWCQPKELNATAAAQRFSQLNYAVDQLARLPNARVYLDGTHSHWLSVDDAANRLLQAGVLRTSGFYLNVSNYYATNELIRYGISVSQCIHFIASAPSTHREQPLQTCANMENSVSTNDHLHFVIDTSRNGRGPWTAPADKYTDPQSWCNPPGRGLGARPTLRTSHPLLDALLWIKVPGESDGECIRGTQGPVDPERNLRDPPAGKWFKEQAAELIELATPPVQR
jgi:endoglucanase